MQEVFCDSDWLPNYLDVMEYLLGVIRSSWWYFSVQSGEVINGLHLLRDLLGVFNNKNLCRLDLPSQVVLKVGL